MARRQFSRPQTSSINRSVPLAGLSVSCFAGHDSVPCPVILGASLLVSRVKASTCCSSFFCLLSALSRMSYSLFLFLLAGSVLVFSFPFLSPLLTSVLLSICLVTSSVPFLALNAALPILLP